MMEYIIAIITAITSFVGAYFASTLSMKNVKREQYFEEKKRVYFELAKILPIVDEFEAQSDYLDGSEGNYGAEGKINIMKIQLEDAEARLSILEDKKTPKNQRYEPETEINNLKYKVEKHQEYMNNMEKLLSEIKIFEKQGNKNLLRIFASQNVWNSYVRFNVALHNEYMCNIGAKKEDITFHINDLIIYMRNDLAGGKNG